MRRAWTLFVLAAAMGSGCSLDLSSNESYCTSAADCGAGRTCRLFAGRDDGLCVAIDAGADAGMDARVPDPDAGPSCEDGAPCYFGPEGTEDVGVCAGGTISCRDGVASCVGQVLPTADDACDGIDQDCDAAFDEGAPATGLCTIAQPGVCAMGERRCDAGQYRCRPMLEAMPELCDGEDDDCDAVTDEDADVACFTGADGCDETAGVFSCTGLCRAGRQVCVDGSLAVDCVGEIVPASAEVCAGAGETAYDEDCDGQVDEGCDCGGRTEQPCYPGPEEAAGQGACALVTQSCEGTTWGACASAVLPTAETCDPGSLDVDEDCNGVVDDVQGLGAACLDESAMGVCRRGALACMDGDLACVTPSPASNESSCDMRDDDCDGLVDEDFDLNTRADHCGACGVACQPGRQCCGGVCVDPQTDEASCGSCGVPCGEGTTCCGGACTDLDSDVVHCGACGNACTGEEICCGGECVDTRSDLAHCGECDAACTGTGEACCNGACADAGSTACTTCAVDCLEPTGTCCGPSCVDVDRDASHCGDCDRGCLEGEVCCGPAADPCVTLADDEANCGACGTTCEDPADTCCDGGCVDTDTDVAHCGACGNPCAEGETCCGGVCANLETDPERCGACDAVDCPATQMCASGHCCPSGQTWCGSDEEGFCVDTSSSQTNCGGCGITCGGSQTCCSGGCVNLLNSNQHCGMCGRACPCLLGGCVGGG